MLDKIESHIAAKLADHHLYPYGREIYINIFRKFSHFPLKLKDLGIAGDGKTITFMAYVILFCFDSDKENFLLFYRNILSKLEPHIQTLFPYNIAVETFLGCVLYYYHPVDVKGVLTSFQPESLFNEKQQYEYELKKNTLLIHAI
jgi:hypothetical protein